MQYEVENKFKIANVTAMVRQLEELGAVFRPAIEQVDTYFQHPAHVFAQTDEALRIRRIGTTNLITYKGPKIDQATKTRHEIELPLAAGAAAPSNIPLCFRRWGFVRSPRCANSGTAGICSTSSGRSNWLSTKWTSWARSWNWRSWWTRPSWPAAAGHPAAGCRSGIEPAGTAQLPGVVVG